MVAPLQGIRVVEVANWLAAPSCAALMADMGADVIKVEPPGGDVFRGVNMKPPGFPAELDLNYPFELDNRGKRSVTVALNQPGGPEVVKRLAATADVFITNLLQRRREQYGLTIEDVQAINPSVIYVSFSGFGIEGPDAERAGFDYAAFWARSGIMSLMGDEDSPPAICRAGQGDHTTALNLLAATLTALRLRDMTGEGQIVDVTLVGTGVWTIGTDVTRSLFDRDVRPPRGKRSEPSNPLVNMFKCSDGQWLLLGMPTPDQYWKAFCRVVERPEWTDDPKLNNLASRGENTKALTAELVTIFASHPRSYWAGRMDAEGVLWAPIVEMPELVRDETLRNLGTFETVQDPRVGSYETLSAPFKVRGADIQVRGPAPTPGEHTWEVLQEAGFSDDEMAELAAGGVLG